MSLTSQCVAATFPTPTLPGAKFLSLQASLVSGYSFPIEPVPSTYRFTQPDVYVQNATFCNITVSYTHPGQNDTVYVESWLPTHNWNGRLQSLGGASWTAGREILSYAGMAGAVFDGYATVTTDAGLGSAWTPDSWAILSPGISNLNALQDLGSVALNDEAIIVKQFIKDLYGQAPSYSYWNGCSQGGRQGAMLAQRYPTAYDGVIAAAPAVYYSELLLTNMWPYFYMSTLNQTVSACELTELTSLATSACDGLDGVLDGIIAEPEQCLSVFDPYAHVGTAFNCSTTGLVTEIGGAAVSLANAIWTGPVSSTGNRLWYGYDMGADLTAVTTNVTTFGVGGNSIPMIVRDFILKQPNATVGNLTHEQFDNVYYSFKEQFGSLIETGDPELGDFRDAGGKMITYHGLADPTITTNSSLHYYNEVSALFPDVQDWYRYFRVPGLAHCWGGLSGQPTLMFDQLRAWVENGTAPNSSPVTITRPDKTTQQRILCPYPRRAVFGCGKNATQVEGCWSCEG